jgi:hypothetical protein
MSARPIRLSKYGEDCEEQAALRLVHQVLLLLAAPLGLRGIVDKENLEVRLRSVVNPKRPSCPPATRGTRLFEGKDYFTVYDFVEAHHHFQDPEWDWPPQAPEPTESRPRKPIDGDGEFVEPNVVEDPVNA